MSLVVARKFGSQIYIVSDTKITYCNRETKPLEGVVKSIILNPFLCVSYAGTVEYANDAIKKYKEKHDYWDFKNQKVIVEHFLDYHKNVSYETEFIISFGKPTVKIFEIKNGLSKVVETSWIGDKDAFELYQNYFITSNTNIGLHNGYFKTRISQQPDGKDANSDIYTRMLQSISQVVENNNIKTVGQFFVPAVFDKELFHYLAYAESFTHQIPLEQMPDVFPLPCGSAETGAYSFSFTEGLHKRKRIIAIYILQGKLGVIFLSENEGVMNPILFKGVTPEEFRNEVKKRYKFKVNYK